MRGLIASLFPSAKVVPNYRPAWLRGCELDAYIQSEKLAFEYDGKQHRAFTPHFHKTVDAFTSQVERDGWKREVCRERGINVLTIVFEDIASPEVFSERVSGLLAAAAVADVEPEAHPKRGRSLAEQLRLASRAQAGVSQPKAVRPLVSRPSPRKPKEPKPSETEEEKREFAAKLAGFLADRPAAGPKQRKRPATVRAKREGPVR